jgi:hypothetical protein
VVAEPGARKDTGMTNPAFTPIAERPASERGALAAHTCTCLVCGLVLSSSLRSLLEHDVAEHARWHERRAERGLDTATLDIATEIALCNPSDAIEGWLAGSQANADEWCIGVYTAALDIQYSWRRRRLRPIADGGLGVIA